MRCEPGDLALFGASGSDAERYQECADAACSSAPYKPVIAANGPGLSVNMGLRTSTGIDYVLARNFMTIAFVLAPRVVQLST
jgi:hypothetical protein